MKILYKNNNILILMEYYYLLIFFFIITIVFRFYVKITYKFWAYQPVFHYYNLFYWIYPIGIVNKDLPESNKYCNFINITNKSFFDYNDKQITEIVDLIRKNYNRNSDADYLPTKESFIAYFTGHNSKSYISVYNKEIYTMEKDKINNENKIIGVISGRPINITIKNHKMRSYYVDFLCVDKFYREKNIAPQLIQTYEYTQRHDNKESKVSLFKREGKLTGIVPLTVYKSYIFNSKLINAEPVTKYKIIEISEVNFYLLREFIDNNKSHFDCIAIVCKSNLLNLIVKNVYKVYGLLENDKIVAIYFFKDNYVTYHVKELYKKEKKSIKSLDLVASINNCNNIDFINGFKNVINKKRYINIENISNNNIIIDNLLNNSLKPINIAPMAYFYYNYISRPITANKVLIII